MSLDLQPPKKDFFVSYTRTDRHWAEWIAWHLEENGYTCILQKWDFRSGGNFVLDMQEATQAEHTIAVLSPDYLKAPFPQAEWAAAFAQDPTSKDRKLIPVRVQECKPYGLLAAIGYIDLVDLEEHEALAKLLQGVSGQRAKPTSAPGFPGKASSSSASSHLATGSSTPPPFPKGTPAPSSIEILIVNAENDETFRKEIEKRLRPLERVGKITIWHIGRLQAGGFLQSGVNSHFYKAKIILLLASPDFFDSQDCQMLMQEAMKRAKAQEARVIPIIVRSCDWEDSPFNILVVLPRNKKPVSLWPNKDAVYLEIIKEIRDILPNP